MDGIYFGSHVAPQGVWLSADSSLDLLDSYCSKSIYFFYIFIYTIRLIIDVLLFLCVIYFILFYLIQIS